MSIFTRHTYDIISSMDGVEMLSAQKEKHEPLDHVKFKLRSYQYDLLNYSLNGLSGVNEGGEYDTAADWVVVQSGWHIPWATLETINEFNVEWGVESKAVKIDEYVEVKGFKNLFMLAERRRVTIGDPSFGKAETYALIDLTQSVASDNEKFVEFMNLRR